MLGVVGRIEPATSVFGDFELTMDELRAVARYVTESAQAVLPVFEESVPDDRRPRAALDAAREFVDGARRTRLQRVTALDAHRAAKDAPTEAASLAARCAGDAAAAAYLHPIAKATQVGHILRAAASAARIAELRADGDPGAVEDALDDARRRATSVVVDVLSRYPLAPTSRSRVGELMSALDTSLRRRT
ncbi:MULTISPECIES: putative immunity protein [Rhodococcus]|uniref:Exonuclease SbcC n=2 Tax=Rhodococcus rhodochrous TaxID=1829 RepID=A0AA47AAV8_RHORH|nr:MULTISPECIES: exonuclease SbcC [Rhodococcus]UZF45545.1 exonuclease SbcC [Rhodococcus rhodochrous]WSE23152.1 exonuclease SbcC [Rhodococcus sp. PD04]